MMRRAGRVVAEMHDAHPRRDPARGHHRASSTPIGRDVLDRRGATSNFLGYHGFPAVICASPNDMIVHGIPGDRPPATRATSSRSTAGPSSTAGTATPRSPRASATITPEAPAPDRRHRGVAARRHRADGRRATASATSATPCRAWPRPAGFSRRARVRRPRHRPGHARAARGARTTGAPGKGPKLRVGQRARRRADGQRRVGPTPCLLDDDWTVVTADGRLVGPLASTPSPSPTTAPRS